MYKMLREVPRWFCSLSVDSRVNFRSHIIHKIQTPGSFPSLLFFLPCLLKNCVLSMAVTQMLRSKGSFLGWWFGMSILRPCRQCYRGCVYPQGSSPPGCLDCNVPDWPWERTLGRRFGEVLRLREADGLLFASRHYPSVGDFFQIMGATSNGLEVWESLSPSPGRQGTGGGSGKMCC